MNKTLKPPEQYKPVISKFLNGHKNTYLQASHAEIYLYSLADNGRISGATQRLTASALKWYYKKALGVNLKLTVPYRKRPLPTVLSIDEVRNLLNQFKEPYLLIFQLMFGLGLKIGEVTSLRIKHIDINGGIIHLPKNRKLKIPAVIFDEIVNHLRKRQRRYAKDRLSKTCWIQTDRGRLNTGFEEQPFFASRKRTQINSHCTGRSFIDPSTIHALLKKAYKAAGISKPVTTMTMRHSFAVETLKEKNHTVVELSSILGHRDIRLTMHYSQMLNRPGIINPLDNMPDTPERKFKENLRSAIIKPNKKDIHSLISRLKNQKLNFVSRTSSQENWDKWQQTAKAKQINCSYGLNSPVNTDYIFLSCREILRGDITHNLKLLYHLIHRGNIKKILLYIPPVTAAAYPPP